MATLSEELVEKSIAAAISAIEIYNKPDFRYREETFAILMTTAWELLLKARAVKAASDSYDAIIVKDSKTSQARSTRSGNPLTHEVTYLSRKALDDPASGLTSACHANIGLLIEVRDNAVHFMNRDIHFGRRVQEIGTASLKNYLGLVSEWFSRDMSRYNFYLMPLSFYHGFEAVESVSVNSYNLQTQNFLRFVEAEEAAHAVDDLSGQQVTVCVETKFSRGKAGDGMRFQWSNDPTAPVMQLKEEELFKQFPMDHRALLKALHERYENFREDKLFNDIKRRVHREGKRFCIERFLDPIKKSGTPKRFYSSEIFAEFDKTYTPKKRVAKTIPPASRGSK